MAGHDTSGTEAEALALVKERLYAFCFPNVPGTEAERAAFDEAARLQLAHEAENAAGAEMPAGVRSFRIGDFQMELEEGTAGGRLTRRSVCPAAYGLLLRHGLLYRGAEGRK